LKRRYIEVVLSFASQQQKTIATAERNWRKHSSLLSSVVDSAYFRGSIVSYARRKKIDF
jgi:nicotinamide mononucleotide (NMN) deamidase PncC